MNLPLLICLPERIDTLTAPDLQAQLRTLLDLRPAKLVIDLSDVSYMNSSGVRMLLQAHKAISDYHGKWAILGCRPMIQQVLQICGLTNMTYMANSLEAAKLYLAQS